MTLDCLVVGGGIHGLCAAFWLRLAGHRRIAVVDRFGPGHDRGSSHGATRITRSSYREPQFVQLAAAAHRDGWPALERELGGPLRTPTPGVFFGPADGPFAEWLRATAAVGEIRRVDVGRARRAFPLLRFADDDAVLVDDSAAVVHAAATMQRLREWLAAAGVDLLWHQPVERIAADAGMLAVVTAAGTLRCRGVVCAAGADTARLVPGFSTKLTVLRQQVGYFDVDADEAALAPGRFPVWARIGRTANDFHYGLPDHAGAGLKAAVHRTEGPGDDPESLAPAPDRAALLALARERFTATVRGLRATESCLYTMAAGQEFTIARAPAEPRIVAVAACSGHGFKFGPIVGRMAAELLRG